MIRTPGTARVATALGLFALALAAVLAIAPQSARAGSITAGETRIESADPREVSFRVSVEAPSSLESARFIYKVLNPDGNVGGGGVAEFVPATRTDVTFTLGTVTASRYIPVGSEFVIQWELTDRDGTKVTTDEESFVFLDGRYDWQNRTEGAVTVYWYGSNQDRADLAFEATRSSLADTEALLEATVEYPVKVMVWASESDGDLARQPRGETFDSQVVTGGQRVAPDLIFVFTPDVDVIRHETAHIVTKVAGDGAFTRVPSWLDEGTAVYMQNTPGSGYSSAIRFAIETGAPLNLRSLQSPANEASLINLFYGQSWSTVDFMVSNFGEEAFAEVYRTIKAGSPTDDALMAVYGVDQNGLYNLWREANGMTAIDFGSSAAGTAVPGAEATRAPLAIPTSVAAAPRSGAGAAGTATSGASGADSSDGGSDGGSGASGIIVALVTLLIVAALGGSAFALSRRGRA
ncbi:MAG: hypothetical protein DWG79_00185 [Chloroflexi bacterium]|nr:peptidase MA family metallohydrolase [Chloroflexota bacterium]MDA1146405.1 peptidase MA family metallohydrolase [Chloroflexota bacterium]MQC82276.1 hypothetical protein [Chloroflexota bacterium]MQC82665.1 hypothetical protein [Chloroflexota bacterium]PKB56728.1 MAG: hypothetical protein BZY69_00330 [SAR202 cluster bacterium Casp-Chloro-G1]